MKAVILAAESGAELGQKEIPKALVKVLGLTLLERNLHTLQKAGINDFVIIAGYKAELIKNLIREKSLSSKFNLRLIKDKNYQRGNAYSVLAARKYVDKRFLILPVGIVFDPDMIGGLKEKGGDLVVCIDSKPRHVDVGFSVGGKKETNIFLCSKNIFPKIENYIKNGTGEWGDCAKELMKRGKANVHDVKGFFWYKIDTPRELKNANGFLLERACLPGDEFLSRNVFRKSAIILAKPLAATRIAPNQVTLLAFMTCLLAAFFFSFGEHPYFIIGAIFIVLYPILDHTDGLIARVKFMESKYGEWLDAVAQFGIGLAFLGMTFGLYKQDPSLLILVIGALAVFGSWMETHLALLKEEVFGLSRMDYLRAWQTKGKTSKAFHIVNKTRSVLHFLGNASFFLILIGGIFNQMFYVLLFLCLLHSQWIPAIGMQLVLFRSYLK